MSKIRSNGAVGSGSVREVVAVFATAEALEAAVAQLEGAGFNHAAMSVLSVKAPRSGHIDALYRAATEIADDPAAHRAAFVSLGTRTEGEVIAIALPLQVGGFVGAWAVAAAGGALLAGIGATIVGGAVGAGLGAILFHAVARHHSDYIQSQLANGGLLLWVTTPDDATEATALDVMHRCGGQSAHAHRIAVSLSARDAPLDGVQLDPMLERDPRQSPNAGENL